MINETVRNAVNDIKKLMPGAINILKKYRYMYTF